MSSVSVDPANYSNKQAYNNSQKLKGNMANTARTRPVSVPSSGSKAMEHQDHSVLLADNRFLKLSKPRKDIPFRLCRSGRLSKQRNSCIKQEELDLLTTQSHKALEIFEDATNSV
jgi:hypothetical protein